MIQLHEILIVVRHVAPAPSRYWRRVQRHFCGFTRMNSAAVPAGPESAVDGDLLPVTLVAGTLVESDVQEPVPVLRCRAG